MALIIKYFFLMTLLRWKSDAVMAAVTSVGMPLSAAQRTSLCKFPPITGGYNICQKVVNTDGTPDVLRTTSLDLMCDAVMEALNFSCSRCLTLESPLGSNHMVATCALTADCGNSYDDEAAWLYLTTQALDVEVPASQRCQGNRFKTVHEECSAEEGGA